MKKKTCFLYGLLIIISIFIFLNFLLFSGNAISSKDTFNIKEKEISQIIVLAEKGDIRAIKKLQNYYIFSVNDLNKAAIYFLMGVKLGNHTSHKHYVNYLRDSQQVEKFEDYMKWLIKSATNNNAFSQRELYLIYKDEKFIDKNLTKSKYWLQRLKVNLLEL